MTNFEKRIKTLTIESLLLLEDEIFECKGCYCREFCESSESNGLPCYETRKLWLNLDVKED